MAWLWVRLHRGWITAYNSFGVFLAAELLCGALLSRDHLSLGRRETVKRPMWLCGLCNRELQPSKVIDCLQMLKVRMWEHWGCWVIFFIIIYPSKVCWAYKLFWSRMHLGAVRHNHSFYLWPGLSVQAGSPLPSPAPIFMYSLETWTGDCTSLPQVKSTMQAYSQTWVHAQSSFLKNSVFLCCLRM